MSSELGNGPEDWDYQQYPVDDATDARWALPVFALCRGIVAWVTGRDPVLERRRQNLARQQAENTAKYASLEEAAYRHLGAGPATGHGDGTSPSPPS